MVAPIIAAGGIKAAEHAGRALTGDIYTRRWTTVKGTGRKKKLVDHELRVNPVSVGLGLVAAGVAAAGAAAALWFTQRKLTTETGADIVRVWDSYGTTYKTVTTQVLVTPATEGYYATTIIRGQEKTMWVPGTEAVYTTVTKTVVDKPGYVIVSNTYGVPIKRLTAEVRTPDDALLTREKSLGYSFVEVTRRIDLPATKDGQPRARAWYKYHSDTDKKMKLGDRPGFIIDI